MALQGGLYLVMFNIILLSQSLM